MPKKFNKNASSTNSKRSRSDSQKPKTNQHSSKNSSSKSRPNNKKVEKTKHIHKQISKPKGGKNLFKIIPMGMDDDQEDKFAAIGKVSEDQNEQVDVNQQEFDDEESENKQQYEEDANQQVEQQQGNDDMQEQHQQIEGRQNEGEFQQIEEKQQNLEGQKIQQPQQKQQHVDISVIKLQIQQTISILMNVARLGQGLPRKHYVQKLKEYIHQYYGYNYDLINHFMDLFNPTELIQFLQANQSQRPLTIRTNTLKTRRKQLAQALIQRGVNLDPLAEWSKVGIKIYETKVPIGATPQYLAGHYMLQSASSLLPVVSLDPQMGQRVLDLASAPGGKTTYIAQLMKNSGCVFANDLKKQRLRALQFNLHRMGITNTIVTCRDGRKYPQIYPNTFDRVLLDAPCTGLGIISKDQSIKANRVLIDIYKNSHVQKELLLAAIDCAKINGVIVYSTCSISPLENEEVVNFALKKRFVKIVDANLQVGEEGVVKFGEKRFHLDLRKTRRIYPHVHNMDGFYVAKLIKIGKGKKQDLKKDQEEQAQENDDQ